MEKKEKPPFWKLSKPIYLKKTDERYLTHLNQLKTRGFSDGETWSLYSNIALFIIPRLKRFREIHAAFPCSLTIDEWKVILDKMIWAFEYPQKEGAMPSQKEYKKEWRKYEEGMKLFSKWFMALWW